MLARSPKEFEKCRYVSCGNGNFSISNLGLRIEMDTMRLDSDKRDEGLYLGRLNAQFYNFHQDRYTKIAIVLQNLGYHNCVRISVDHIENWHKARLQDYMKRTLYFEHLPRIPLSFESRMVHSIRFRRGTGDYPVPAYRIQTIRSAELITSSPPGIIVPHNPDQLRHDFQFPALKDVFLVCAKLIHEEYHEDTTRNHPEMLLLIGYHKNYGYSWCRILENSEPDINDSIESWCVALQRMKTHQKGYTRAVLTGAGGRINIRLALEVLGDELCLMIDIDGLIV
jgi:hypothetical protein